MTRLSIAVLLLLVPAAARAGDDCARACNHMRVISEKEMAGMTELSPAEKKRISDKSNADEPARMKKCVAACAEGRVDTACVFAAKETMAYVRCLKPRNAAPSSLPPAEQKELLAVAQTARSFRGRALSAGEAGKILSALNTVDPRHRLPLLGAALAESAPSMYGADLVEAFTALSQSAGDRVGFAMLARPLAVPIAVMGCAHAFADAVRLVPAEQAAIVAAGCPATGPRYFTAKAIERAELPRLMLALVMEHRAREGGFASDALHKRAIQILLGN